MVESSKWVECDAPGQPAGSVVCTALAGRLAVVSHYLESATEHEVHETERIHQLRVATRRSGAAMSAFAKFLPRRKAERMRRALKRIRRAAGSARDFDVLADRYREPRKAIADSAQDWLRGRISDARREARLAVDEVFHRYGRGRFARRAAKLVARMRWRGHGDEPTFAALARERLDRAAREFFQIAERRPRRAPELHELRIAAKRFRYVLELFSPLAAGLRDDIYPVVEQVQQKLGKANDRAVGANRLASWQSHREDDPATDLIDVDAIAKRERKRAAAARREFRDWWTTARCESLARRYDELMAASA